MSPPSQNPPPPVFAAGPIPQDPAREGVGFKGMALMETQGEAGVGVEGGGWGDWRCSVVALSRSRAGGR